MIEHVRALKSGQELFPEAGNPALFQTATGNRILKLSRAFSTNLQAYLDKGYQLEQIHAQYIVVWKDKETGEEVRVVLPAVRLSRKP